MRALERIKQGYQKQVNQYVASLGMILGIYVGNAGDPLPLIAFFLAVDVTMVYIAGGSQ